MSLFEAKLPSLRDKIRGQAEQVKVSEVKVEKKEEVKKGRRLNK